MTIRVNRRFKRKKGMSRIAETSYNPSWLAQSVLRMQKRLGHQELKHLDYVFTAVSPTLNGLVTLISGIAQGDTNITRDGNKILVKKIEWGFEWSIIPDTGTPDTGAFSNNRLMILKDTQANGVVITNANVIDQTAIAETYAPRQIDSVNPGRIIPILDRKFEMVSLGQQTTTQAYADMSRGTKMIVGSKTYKTGIPLFFLGTGNGQTACGKNTLYTLFASDAAQGALVSGYVRMHFLDA